MASKSKERAEQAEQSAFLASALGDTRPQCIISYACGALVQRWLSSLLL